MNRDAEADTAARGRQLEQCFTRRGHANQRQSLARHSKLSPRSAERGERPPPGKSVPVNTAARWALPMKGTASNSKTNAIAKSHRDARAIERVKRQRPTKPGTLRQRSKTRRRSRSTGDQATAVAVHERRSDYSDIKLSMTSSSNDIATADDAHTRCRFSARPTSSFPLFTLARSY